MHMRSGTISAAADKADDLTLTHALTGRNGNPAHMPVSSFITIAVIDTYIASITAVPTGNLYRSHRTGVNRFAEFNSNVKSSPGSIAQVRECSASILRFAKETHTPVLLIGHINKEGSIAGPKVLEHIVDTVLQFEGDQHYMYRILRSIKNRFGSTAELGIYEMRQDGLRQVSNPSELLLSQDHEGMSGVAIASAIEGVRPFLIETQALVSSAVYGNPQRSATGFDIRRMNMLLAVLEKRVGFKLAQKDVFLNIAGGLKVNDPAIDLAVISAILSSNMDAAIEPEVCMAGEIGLSGEIRPVNRIEQRIGEAEKLGFKRFILPKYNMQGIDTKKLRIELVPVRKVEEAFRTLFG